MRLWYRYIIQKKKKKKNKTKKKDFFPIKRKFSLAAAANFFWFDFKHIQLTAFLCLKKNNF